MVELFVHRGAGIIPLAGFTAVLTVSVVIQVLFIVIHN